MDQNNKLFPGTIFLATICCREKDRAGGLLPAVRRYRSPRIRRLAELAGEAGLPLVILSGLYGLIEAGQPIPYYDRLMTAGDIPRIAGAGAEFLKNRSAEGVVFCLPDPEIDPHVKPYLESMKEAAAAAGAGLRVFFLPPYPRVEEIRTAFDRRDISANG